MSKKCSIESSVLDTSVAKWLGLFTTKAPYLSATSAISIESVLTKTSSVTEREVSIA